MKKIVRVNLTQMKAGEKGAVVGFDGGHGLQQRLSSMGIRPGKSIVKLNSFALRGPVTVRAGRTVLALGHGMASKIWIEPDRK